MIAQALILMSVLASDGDGAVARSQTMQLTSARFGAAAVVEVVEVGSEHFRLVPEADPVEVCVRTPGRVRSAPERVSVLPPSPLAIIAERVADVPPGLGSLHPPPLRAWPSCDGPTPATRPD